MNFIFLYIFMIVKGLCVSVLLYPALLKKRIYFF